MENNKQYCILCGAENKLTDKFCGFWYIQHQTHTAGIHFHKIFLCSGVVMNIVLTAVPDFQRVAATAATKGKAEYKRGNYKGYAHKNIVGNKFHRQNIADSIGLAFQFFCLFKSAHNRGFAGIVFFLLCESSTAVLAVIGFQQVIGIAVFAFHLGLPFLFICFNYTTRLKISQQQNTMVYNLTFYPHNAIISENTSVCWRQYGTAIPCFFS